MKAVVIGANGFIGAHSAAALRSLGAELELVGRRLGRWRLDALGIDCEIKRLADADLRGADVIVAMNGSSLPSVMNDFDVRRVGRELALHQRLLKRLLANDERPLVVVGGSRTEYGRPGSLPVAESAGLAPQSSYAAEKALVAQLYAFAARDAGLPSVRLRITNPYGPFEWEPGRVHGLPCVFVNQAVTKGAISVYGDGSMVRDYVHINDVTRLLKLIVAKQHVGSVAMNTASGAGNTIGALATCIAESVGGIDVNYVPMPQAAAQIETGDFVADMSLATDSLGWVPQVGFDDGVAQVARFEADRIRSAHAEQ